MPNAVMNRRNKDCEVHDYYATDPRAVEMLLEHEQFTDTIWEPACGEGHISKVLLEHGYGVVSTDLIDRGYGCGNVDFLESGCAVNYNIITNPPYKLAKEFVLHALQISNLGNKVAMLLKLTFLEGQARRDLFEKHPPKVVYVFSRRIECGKNGQFSGASAVAYAWFVWEKGFTGETVVKWI